MVIRCDHQQSQLCRVTVATYRSKGRGIRFTLIVDRCFECGSFRAVRDRSGSCFVAVSCRSCGKILSSNHKREKSQTQMIAAHRYRTRISCSELRPSRAFGCITTLTCGHNYDSLCGSTSYHASATMAAAT